MSIYRHIKKPKTSPIVESAKTIENDITTISDANKHQLSLGEVSVDTNATWTIEGDGEVVITDLVNQSSKPVFSSTLTSNQTVSTATWTKLNFDNVIEDSANSFNETNKEYSIPSDGIYLVYAQCYRDYGANGTHMRVALSINGTRDGSSIFTDGQGIAHTAVYSAVKSLTTGDKVTVDTYHSKGTDEVYSAGNNQQFYIIKLK